MTTRGVLFHKSPACRVIVENCTKLYVATLYDSRFASLFSVDFAASLLGMFELNCLGITVESPVEDLRDEIRSTKKRDGSLSVNAKLKEHFKSTEAIFKMLGSTDVPVDVRSRLLAQCSCGICAGGGEAARAHMLGTSGVQPEQFKCLVLTPDNRCRAP